jgi:hypothetical protein
MTCYPGYNPPIETWNQMRKYATSKTMGLYRNIRKTLNRKAKQIPLSKQTHHLCLKTFEKTLAE